MECAENNDQGLGSDDRLSGRSRDDVLTPRAARAGLDAGDSGNGFGSWNRGVLTSQAGRAIRHHEASRQERDTPKRTAIGNQLPRLVEAGGAQTSCCRSALALVR